MGLNPPLLTSELERERGVWVGRGERERGGEG